MKLEHSFEVQAPLERVWAALVDVEYVAPCLPGAEVTGRDEEGAFRGTFTVKLGPTTAAYDGVITIEEADEAAHQATLHARGTDKRGQGAATATIVNTLSEAGPGVTRVEAVTDFSITGRLARFGRGGMMQDISARLLRDFAECLQGKLAAAPDGAQAAAEPSEPAAEPSEPAAEPPVPLADPEAESGAPEPLPEVPEVADEEPAPAAPADSGLTWSATEPEPSPEAAEAAEPSEPAAPPSSWINAEPLPPLEPVHPVAPAAPPAPGTMPEAPVPGIELPPVTPVEPEPAAAPEPEPIPPAPEPALTAPQAQSEPVPPPPDSDFLPPPVQAEEQLEPEVPAPRTGSVAPPGYTPATAQGTPASAGGPRPAKPVNGLSLFFSVLWQRIKRSFRGGRKQG